MHAPTVEHSTKNRKREKAKREKAKLLARLIEMNNKLDEIDAEIEEVGRNSSAGSDLNNDWVELYPTFAAVAQEYARLCAAE